MDLEGRSVLMLKIVKTNYPTTGGRENIISQTPANQVLTTASIQSITIGDAINSSEQNRVHQEGKSDRDFFEKKTKRRKKG